MIRAKFTCSQPDDIEFTLSTSMTLAHWRKLSSQLGDFTAEWPAADLVRAIRDTIQQAEKTYYANVEEPT